MTTTTLELMPATAAKYAALQGILREMGRVVIGFSGGVDSTMLLRAALDVLPADDVLAVIGDSESYPSREFAEAKRLAESMGARFRVVQSEEMNDPRYTANPSNRCYFCKSDLFSRLCDIARAEGFAAVLDGNNADDRGDYRPGQQAARELGVRSPLMEVEMTKAEVREVSRAFGLPTWNKPAFACLSSRIPYGTPITKASLSAIEQAESFLRDLGFEQVRVRHHDTLARIEVAPDLVARLMDPALRAQVTAKLKELGYQYVTLDLQGYRMGSMNEVL
jgi:uncharacterized protein